MRGPNAKRPTSGTGFFVYGLAWGVNQGLLKDPHYARSTRRGWDALARAVGPDGKLYAHATTTCLVFDRPAAKVA